MAIRLQSATLSSKFSYICTVDDAVDIDRKDFKEAWQKYREGGDPPLREGVEPTIWELTPITNTRQRSYLQAYQENHGGTALCVAYAASGITGVSNLLDEEGKPVEIEREWDNGYETMTERQVALIPPLIMVEIGRVLLMHDTPNAG